MNEKWRYVIIFKAETYGNFAMGKKVVRPQLIPPNIVEVLLPRASAPSPMYELTQAPIVNGRHVHRWTEL
jgi:hypothetical protein